MADLQQDLHVFAVEIANLALLRNDQLEMLLEQKITPEVLLKMPSDQFPLVLGVTDVQTAEKLQSLAIELLEEAGRPIPKRPSVGWFQRILKFKRKSSLMSWSSTNSNKREDDEYENPTAPGSPRKSAFSPVGGDHTPLLEKRPVQEQSSAEVVTALMREKIVDKHEASVLLRNQVDFHALKLFFESGGDDGDIGVYHPATLDRLYFWLKSKFPILQDFSSGGDETATAVQHEYRKRPEDEELEPEDFANMLAEEGVIQHGAEEHWIASQALTMLAVMSDQSLYKQENTGLCPASVASMDAFLHSQIVQLSPKSLAKLMMGNQVNLTAHQARCISRFNLDFATLKLYTSQALHDIGITSVMAQERIFEWVHASEEDTTVTIELLSAFHFADLLVEKEIIAEHEAEILVRKAVTFPLLKQHVLRGVNWEEELGISSRVTQLKLALYCNTQNERLCHALQVIKNRRRLVIRNDLIEALGGEEQINPDLLRVIRQGVVAIEAVELLLQSPNLSVQQCGSTCNGETLLHLACKVANVDAEFISFLIASKVQINVQDVCGTTALMLASKCGNADTVRQLLTSGANVALENHFGFTALELAVQYNAPAEVLTLLIAAGSDVNHVNRTFTKQSVLWFAVERNNAANVSVLLNTQATTHNIGDLLRFVAKRNGDALIATELIQRLPLADNGAFDGFSPTRLLAQHGAKAQVELVRVFMRSGFKVVEEDKSNLLTLCKQCAKEQNAVAAQSKPVFDMFHRGLMAQALLVLLATTRKTTQSALRRLPNELIRCLGTFVA